MIRLLLIVIAALVPWAVAAEGEQPNIYAIGRYAIETNMFSDLHEYAEKTSLDEIQYDERFRHPYSPPGAVVVDCQKTHRIGVSLAIDIPARPERRLHTRSDAPWSKMIKVQHHWRHSSDDELARSYYVKHEPYRGNVLSGGLTLSKKHRIEGVWTVTVTNRGKEIYETSFRLVRCPTENS